jgi:zinc transport system ATP-binding protein
MNELPVSVSGVSFTFPGGEHPVLEDVDLRIEQYDYIGIIGPNGGGKTTLLRLMLGLLAPDTGEIRIFGAPPREARHRIGYVPQRASLDLDAPASVLDVVLTGCLASSSWGWHWGAASRRAAHEALDRTGCADLAKRTVDALSGGQRQRVLIARALAGNAEMLILDEPMAGVDEPMQQGLSELLATLNDDIPIVVVSHDTSFVSTRVRHVACVNRRVDLHAADEMDEGTLAHVYHGHGPVRAVHHESECPVGHGTVAPVREHDEPSDPDDRRGAAS